jgi:hypothetical protein
VSSPNWALVTPKAAFIVSAAKPMLTRSRKATTNRRKSRGMMRFHTLRIVLVEISLAATVFPAPITPEAPSSRSPQTSFE